MDASPIPIENIYYLLCYAWDKLEQGRFVDVSRLKSTELVDLFAAVLIQGVERLAKRGLERTYTTREEEFPGIRGRVDLLQTERRLLRKHGRAACRYDELSANSLPNQIIKSTLKLLGPEARSRVTRCRGHADNGTQLPKGAVEQQQSSISLPPQRMRTNSGILAG
jgi:5-methylcytosine-specific restriction enzyme subunit McrC